MASIEGLLHEVGRVRIQDRLELKAAEDLYYGGKQLYTNILPQSHHGGGGGGGGQHAEGSGGHGGQHHGGHGRRSQQTSESDPHTPGGGHRGGHHRGHGNRGGDHHATSPGHDKSTTNPVIQAIAETREKVNKALKNEPTAAAGGVQPCAGKGQHHGISVKWYTMVIGGRHHRNSNRRSESNETHTTEELLQQMAALKKENERFRAELKEIREIVERLSKTHLHSGGDKSHPVSAPVGIEKKQPATPAPATKKTDDDGDDDFELFGSDDDEESAEKKKLTEQRLADYAAKKSKKPGPIAKSSVILDVKPWDDETDMEELEKQVRAIQRDGLVWGGGKMIPLAYGIRKLQIICVIEDDKVSVDDLIETIQEDIADHVQSVDIHAFNKI